MMRTTFAESVPTGTVILHVARPTLNSRLVAQSCHLSGEMFAMKAHCHIWRRGFLQTRMPASSARSRAVHLTPPTGQSATDTGRQKKTQTPPHKAVSKQSQCFMIYLLGGERAPRKLTVTLGSVTSH